MWRQVRVVVSALAAALAACGGGGDAPSGGKGVAGGHAGPRRDPGASPPAGTQRIAGKDHVIDVRTPAGGCVAGQPCVVTLEAIALGDFKINADYPHRFVPGATGPAISVGPIASPAVNVAEVPLTVNAAAPGALALSGELKLGVCNDDRCEIYETPIAIGLTAR